MFTLQIRITWFALKNKLGLPLNLMYPSQKIFVVHEPPPPSHPKTDIRLIFLSIFLSETDWLAGIIITLPVYLRQHLEVFDKGQFILCITEGKSWGPTRKLISVAINMKYYNTHVCVSYVLMQEQSGRGRLKNILKLISHFLISTFRMLLRFNLVFTTQNEIGTVSAQYKWSLVLGFCL